MLTHQPGLHSVLANTAGPAPTGTAVVSRGCGERLACETSTAGTAMAVPVFEEEKWRCWDSDLRARRV